MFDYTESIQKYLDKFYEDHMCIPDEAIDDAMNEFWDMIPENEIAIEISHPGIDDGNIIIEFNPEYSDSEDCDEEPYFIYRIYNNKEDYDNEEDAINIYYQL